MKKVFILIVPILFMITASTTQEKIIIKGTVKDENGKPIAATIQAGHTVTHSDVNGNYSIALSEKKDYLAFSAPGYITYKATIKNKTVINVIMRAATSAMQDSSLQEVIVTTVAGARTERKIVGYSTKRVKSELSGAYVSKAPSRGYQPGAMYNNEGNTEEYSNISENAFHGVKDYPVSTFSIDVDAASYSNVRRYIENGQLPPAGAVRTEEMINYFKYQYPQPKGKHPFSINTETGDCPWNKENKLVLIGLQGLNIPVEQLPPCNLVFLVDVSGSMMSENKLPLVKASLKMLTDQLREGDRISIVVYAGSAGLVLPSTGGSNKTTIKAAIDDLEAGGSTAGGAGIRLAYTTARENKVKNGNNRVILCTDGDFNVGASSDDAMVRLIENERGNGIFLTVLGFGMGNYKDSKMQQLADKGNGNHAYIDGISEAKKVLVNEFGGTLFTIAKDVKLQIEFNPAKVAGYRLIGYENRLLNKQDFNDDKKDAGELGSGHTVTALYEIIPFGVSSGFLKTGDPLKYQKSPGKQIGAFADEILTIKFRYKEADNDNSKLITHPVIDNHIDVNHTSDNFRFATSVAAFAMLLNNSQYKGNTTFSEVLNIAGNSLGKDVEGYRRDFISVVKKAAMLNSDKAGR